MSKEISAFVEDDAHEKFVQTLVDKLATQYDVEVKLDFRSSTGGKGKALSKLKQYFIDLNKGSETLPDLVIVAIDANCDTYAVKNREIENILKNFPQYDAGIVVIAIPDPHIERWALLDSSAFRETFGKGCDAPDKKCDRDRYKNVLIQEIKKAGWDTVNGAEHIPFIVANMNLARMKRKKGESLGKFIDILEKRFKGWAED